MNKKKIFNDPVYGFVSVPYEIIFDLIEHPYFQRLRNIKQLGLTHLVYPGALHTRFHHALGAMHLMSIALETLKNKGVKITEEESKAVTIAILLHDIGHGPFSHALESCIVPSIHHEDLSILLMKRLNIEFKGALTLAIEIFENKYDKKFLHQLVSGQLDMDRMDYLNRDSFYTGVSEGVIGFDRILKMICVIDDQLVIEEKGIYSIEKFLIARRLMYWQVYYHKTVISAEQLLVKVLRRAKEISVQGKILFATPSFSFLLKNNPSADDFKGDERYLDAFANIDDHDIYSAIKVWTNDEDVILSKLCTELINRRLYSIEIQNENISSKEYDEKLKEVIEKWGISEEDAEYFVFTGVINNNAYDPLSGNIYILTKTKGLQDIAVCSDGLNLEALSKNVKKHFLCYPKYI
ncbi:MAG: HD domain-containing protein [Sphingobacteriales bacterium]|nr:HD domain-containing protein [Sphingobacteriales bacterium]